MEALIKGGVALGAALGLGLDGRLSKRFPRWRSIRGPLLATAALVAGFASVDFGRFHEPNFVHRWEQFHYYLGSKYFPELGYDGLYVASVAAQIQTAPARPLPRHLRDLRTNRIVPLAELGDFGRTVFERFDPERWRSFLRDHRTFLETVSPLQLDRMRLDHGYNPPPSATFVQRLFSAGIEATPDSLVLLALIDQLLLVLLAVCILRTFGYRALALCVLVYGLGYGWRFHWTGGALLRQDWLVAWSLSICALRASRPRLAGALSGYAAAVRIFPGLLILPLVVAGWRRRGRGLLEPWLQRYLAAFVLALVLGAGAGSLTGRGPAVWQEFARNLRLHADTWLNNNVGLENLPIYDGTLLRRELVDFSQPEPWLAAQRHVEERRRALWPLIWLPAGIYLLMVGLAARRDPPVQAALLGPVVPFALLSLTCYYWVMLSLLPLRRERWLPAALLLLDALLYPLGWRTDNHELLYGAMSWGLALIFAVWLIVAVRRPSPDPEGVRQTE